MSDDNQTPSSATAPAKKPRQRRHKSPRFTVTITADRIAESVRRSSSHCMIAETIKEAHPELSGITVDLATIRFSDAARQLRFTYLTPRIAQEALILFDQGVVPPEFEMELRRASQITRSAKWGALKRTQDKPTERTQDKPANHTQDKPVNRREEKPDTTGRLPRLGGARAQEEGGNSIPTIVGGRPPPMGLLIGRAKGAHDNGAYGSPGNIARRRMFGLKMLRM